jgi:hypothetical protein
MKFTNEIFEEYMKASDYEIIEMSKKLGFECAADFEEDIYIWALNCGDKENVMKLYELDETAYEEACELWADEINRRGLV